MSTERVIVIRAVANALMTAVLSLVTKLKTGIHVGPVFTEAHAQELVDLVKKTEAQGATVVHGNMERDGATVGPHLIANIQPGMELWEKESFGPGI